MEGRKGVGGQGGKNAKVVDMPRQGRKRAIPGGDHLTTRGKMQRTVEDHVGRAFGAGCSSNIKLGDASSGECGKFINFWRHSQ